MRVLSLYRPALPGQRAQAIGVVHAAHALARRGHTVSLYADRAGPGDPASALADLGLDPVPTLDLRLAPVQQPGFAGTWFRAQVLGWSLGPPGVVIARDKRRLQAALPLLGRHRVYLEQHELDSALAEERGEDPSPILALERELLAVAQGLIANCEGTLQLWEGAHGDRLPARRLAVHNATTPARLRAAHLAPAPVIRVLGSLREYKGVAEILAAAPGLPLPLRWTGGTDDERAALSAPPNAWLDPPVPYPAVPDLLADSRLLLLPLTDNLFGRELTSPLKLWDYLATAVPILAPDLPSVRRVAALTGAPMHLWRPGDAADLVRAATEALRAPARAPVLRTWDERAAAVEALIS